MDEKIMEILAQLLQGQTELKIDMDGMKSSMVRMENTFNEKFSILFDFQKSQEAFNQQVLERFDRLEEKVDRLQLETAHVRLVK